MEKKTNEEKKLKWKNDSQVTNKQRKKTKTRKKIRQK